MNSFQNMAESLSTNKDDPVEELRRDEIRLLKKLKQMVNEDKELNEDTILQLQVEREEQENKRFSRWFTEKYESTDQDKLLFEEIRYFFATARSILDARFIRIQDEDVLREIVLHSEPRITARVQCSMEKSLDYIKANPLSNQERTEFMLGRKSTSLTGMQYMSDIYQINGGFNFSVPCCVSIHLSMKYNEKISVLMAVLKENDKWTEIPATLENGHAVFGVRSMNIFYIVTVPKAKEAQITEDGFEYSSDADERICLRIPAKAVDQPTSIIIKVLLPDYEVAKKIQNARDKLNVVAISPCLCVEYKDSKMPKKPVTLTLPLYQPSNSRDYETILLTLDEDNVSRVKTTVQIGDNNVVFSNVPSPRNQLFAVVKKGADVKLLGEEVLLNLGLAMYYKVLSFRDSKDIKALLIECTPLAMVQKVIDKRKKEGYILERSGGQSDPLILRQEQRLRISITGNIEKDVTVPQVAYFITVLFGAQDQKTYFPYKIKGVIGGTHFGNLTISSDNFIKADLCSVHFDPSFVM